MTAWSTRLWWLGGALLVLVVIYEATSAQFLHEWARDPLGHGYLVLPGAAYLAWARRERICAIDSRPAFWWLPLLGLLAFGWLLADVTSTTTVQQFCLAFMVIGLVWGALGTSAARELAFPLGFLLFAIPIGQYLVPTLQIVTAGFAVKLLQFSGVPVLLNYNVISIPGSSWEVADACSGINYLMSALVMAYLYAGVAYRSTSRRTLFFVSAIPVALIANGFRVYITIFVAAAGFPEFAAAGLRHYLVGWMVFGFIVGVMFFIGARFEEPAGPTPSVPDTATPATAFKLRFWGIPTFVVLALGIVVAAPLSAARMTDAWKTTHRPTAAAIAIAVSEPWSSQPDRILGSWTPRAASADATTDRAYRAGAHSVRLIIAQYDPRNGDVEISRRPPGSVGWDLVPAGMQSVALGGRVLSVNESTLTLAGTSMLVWHWYVIDGVATPSGYVAKLLLAGSRLRGGHRPSAVFALATESGSVSDAADTLRLFLDHLTVDLLPATP